MKNYLRLGFAATLATALAAQSDLAAAQASVPIYISVQDRAAVRVCADALVEAIRQDDAAAAVKIVSPGELKKMREAGALGDRVPHAVIDLDLRDETSITAIPLVFRDAAQFLAYLDSDLFAEIGARNHRDRIALAYGGFSQLFSKSTAIAEPEHFKGLTIAGDARAMPVYLAFGATPGLNLLPKFAMPDRISLVGLFDRMEHDHARVNIVEASLGEALASGAERSARFLSLTSSTLMTIGFRDQSLQAFVPREKLERLARTAAASCSRTIYQNELDALDRFRNAGIKVVPFNRPPLIETSWRMAVEKEHAQWTIAQFDRLVALDGGVQGVPLPSAIVATLPPARRRAASQFDEAARKK